MRRFVLERKEDLSGVSGTGIVAQGCVFDNGFVALTWLSHLGSLVWYHSIDVLVSVHGHDGKTEVKYIDNEHSEQIKPKKSKRGK